MVKRIKKTIKPYKYRRKNRPVKVRRHTRTYNTSPTIVLLNPKVTIKQKKEITRRKKSKRLFVRKKPIVVKEEVKVIEPEIIKTEVIEEPEVIIEEQPKKAMVAKVLPQEKEISIPYTSKPLVTTFGRPMNMYSLQKKEEAMMAKRQLDAEKEVRSRIRDIMVKEKRAVSESEENDIRKEIYKRKFGKTFLRKADWQPYRKSYPDKLSFNIKGRPKATVPEQLARIKATRFTTQRGVVQGSPLEDLAIFLKKKEAESEGRVISREERQDIYDKISKLTGKGKPIREINERQAMEELGKIKRGVERYSKELGEEATKSYEREMKDIIKEKGKDILPSERKELEPSFTADGEVYPNKLKGGSLTIDGVPIKEPKSWYKLERSDKEEFE